ncbi:MAG: CpaF family protein [Rubripirellula sp.]
MNESNSDPQSATNRTAREMLTRASLNLPVDRVREETERKSSKSFRSTASTTIAQGNASFATVKAVMHTQLLEDLDRRDRITASEDELSDLVRDFVAEALETQDWPLNDEERGQLVDDLIEETIGVGPLAPLLADPAVTDILVNGPHNVFVERFGHLEKTEVHFRDDEHLVRIIGRIAARVGRRVDESSPMVDARLPDGSRVNATLPPVTIDGPTLSIRRFGRRRLRSDDLLQLGMFSVEMREFLRLAIRGRVNMIVSGGTGSGKSTFLGAMAEAISDSERIITIEDAAELLLDQQHVVRMETRPANIEGQGRIVARDLVVNALRMRPDRIIVGEVRAGEALDMMQAMNTGHDGSLTTIHANSPRDAVARLETMVLMAGLDLPSRAIREQAVSAIDIVIQVRRYEDGVRRVQSISELVGMEGDTPQLQEIFHFVNTGRANRRITGNYVATGVVPRLVERLRENHVDVPMNLFQPHSSSPAWNSSNLDEQDNGTGDYESGRDSTW